jgi:hypothetical protein
VNRKRAKYPLSAEALLAAEAERAVLSDKLAAAREYEAATERVLAASGYQAAYARRQAAQDALAELVGRIMDERPVTMAGVLVQAEALSVWSRTPLHVFHVPGLGWSQVLAASLLRIAGEAPSEQV